MTEPTRPPESTDPHQGRPAPAGGDRPRPPAARTAAAVATWVDQQIQQAQRQGAFDDLPGAGRPLKDVDVVTDPDWWVKGLVERENLDLSAAMPGVMQLRREKAAFPGSMLDEPSEACVRARLEDFNERVLADRRRPHAGSQPPPVVGRVDVEEMVERWRTERLARKVPDEPADLTGSAPGVGAEGSSDDRGSTRRRWWRRR